MYTIVKYLIAVSLFVMAYWISNHNSIINVSYSYNQKINSNKTSQVLQINNDEKEKQQIEFE